MKLLNHPTCIKLLEVLASKTTIFLVLELVTGGELFDRIVTDGRFDEASARKYFIQLVEGLSHCHSNGVCHRDLKPENLLLDAHGDLRITDFGLSSFNENQDERSFLHTTCGTPNYVAPEVLMDKGYEGEAADVWSAGVILYVLLSGFLPFDEAQMVDLFRKIISADFQYPAWLSREAQTLISRMLEPDPTRRATMQEIQESAFFLGKTLEEVDDPLSSRARLLSTFFNWDQDNLTAAAAAAEAKAAASSVGKQRFLSKWKGQRHVVSPSSALTGHGHIQNRRKSLASMANVPISASGAISPASTCSLSSSGSTDPILSNKTPKKGTEETSLTNITTESGSNFPTTAERAEREEERFGPKALNAFDLINMVSGQSMNNMLMFNKGMAAPSFTQFTSRLRTEDSMAIIDYVLLETPSLRYRICYRKCNVSLIWTNQKNHRIGANIELFRLTPELHMVQCKRVDGSILAFHEFYKRFREDVKALEAAGSSAITRVCEKLAEWQSEHDLLESTSQNTTPMLGPSSALALAPACGALSLNPLKEEGESIVEAESKSNLAAPVSGYSSVTTSIPSKASSSSLSLTAIDSAGSAPKSYDSSLKVTSVAPSMLSPAFSVASGSQSPSSLSEEDDDEEPIASQLTSISMVAKSHGTGQDHSNSKSHTHGNSYQSKSQPKDEMISDANAVNCSDSSGAALTIPLCAKKLAPDERSF